MTSYSNKSDQDLERIYHDGRTSNGQKSEISYELESRGYKMILVMMFGKMMTMMKKLHFHYLVLCFSSL